MLPFGIIYYSRINSFFIRKKKKIIVIHKLPFLNDLFTRFKSNVWNKKKTKKKQNGKKSFNKISIFNSFMKKVKFERYTQSTKQTTKYHSSIKRSESIKNIWFHHRWSLFVNEIQFVFCVFFRSNFPYHFPMLSEKTDFKFNRRYP